MTAPTRPLREGLFDLADDGTVTLIGGWSPSSGRHHFPLFDTCPYTGATDVEAVRLPTSGRLWLWTAVTSPPPGYAGPVPYGFGIVELDGIGLRVVGRLAETDPSKHREREPMRLVADEVATDDDGTAVVSWAFAGAS